MKREDAFYYKNLLMLGFSDGYDEWLNYYLETESPLSDIVLELSLCGSDVNKTISLLHNYCAEQNFDEVVSHDKLRLFFKNAYYSNRMSKEEVLSTMYRLAVNVGDPGDFDIKLWGSMYYFDYYYGLALDGVIPMENFDFAFFSYLDNGTPLDSDLIWRKSMKKKPSLLDKISNLWYNKTNNTKGGVDVKDKISRMISLILQGAFSLACISDVILCMIFRENVDIDIGRRCAYIALDLTGTIFLFLLLALPASLVLNIVALHNNDEPLKKHRLWKLWAVLSPVFYILVWITSLGFFMISTGGI